MGLVSRLGPSQPGGSAPSYAEAVAFGGKLVNDGRDFDDAVRGLARQRPPFLWKSAGQGPF
jgi:hypothetical protein